MATIRLAGLRWQCLHCFSLSQIVRMILKGASVSSLKMQEGDNAGLTSASCIRTAERSEEIDTILRVLCALSFAGSSASSRIVLLQGGDAAATCSSILYVFRPLFPLISGGVMPGGPSLQRIDSRTVKLGRCWVYQVGSKELLGWNRLQLYSIFQISKSEAKRS